MRVVEACVNKKEERLGVLLAAAAEAGLVDAQAGASNGLSTIDIRRGTAYTQTSKGGLRHLTAWVAWVLLVH